MKGKFVKRWEDNGRKFCLESRANGADRYLLCSVLDLEAKRFCIVIPKGQGLVKGWDLLAEKLRSVGVTPTNEKGVQVGDTASREKEKKELKSGNIGDFVEIIKKNAGRIGDAIWLQIGGGEWNSREEQLK